MAKQASRIFQEMALIERLLHQSISEYDPTGDDSIDEAMKELLHREVPERADCFVTTLYSIAQNMTFSDWQDFWLDMGIRVYELEDQGFGGLNGWEDYELGEFDDLGLNGLDD